MLEQADDIAWLDDRIAEVSGLIARGGVPEPVDGRLPHGAEVTLRFDDGEVSTMRVVAISEEVAEDAASWRGECAGSRTFARPEADSRDAT